MFRLRILRVLLPALLLVLGWLVWTYWQPRSSVHSRPVATNEEPRAEVVEVIEWSGERRTVSGSAEVFEQGADGRLILEGIRELAIDREERGPLIISAERGDRTGANGQSLWDFDGEVVFREAAEDLELRLPSLVIDEAAGEARSEGDIRFFAPNLTGRGSRLVYGLEGQPGSISGPVIEAADGGRVTADRARLLDGIRDVELIGDVEARRGDGRVDAGRIRLVRGEERLRRAEASERVTGSWPILSGAPVDLRAGRMDVRWDASGAVERFRMADGSRLDRGAESISASWIDADRLDDGGGWEVRAADEVRLTGAFAADRGSLATDRLTALLDANLQLRAAEAAGSVLFEGSSTRAEADRATFDAAALPIASQVKLFGSEQRKARLSHARTRVAAEWIRTDARGTDLLAERRVEASVLPDPEPDGGSAGHLFATDEAVHFVADRLESSRSGERLVFHGSVRGWQQERNLAAEEIIVDQGLATLTARRNVATRIPRDADGTTLSEADYVRIESDALDYDDREGLAVYLGDVRVTLAEGWLKADRVEVDLAPSDRRVSEVRASGSASFEVRRTSERELADPFSGESDRLAYVPAAATLRLYGDRAPASVRRLGEAGGTTTGRVLVYRLDLGTIEVDSGGQGPARIRTSAEQPD